MNIVISPEYEHLRAWLSGIDNILDANDIGILHNGRNKIVLCNSPEGEKLVIKKYKKHNIIKQIAYTLFKPNKAKRSFNNAIELRKRGFETPREVAYLEKRSLGFIDQVYYICAYTDKEAIRKNLIDTTPFDKELATNYARYVACLHSNGVLHRDLNPTNVLFCKNGDEYKFELIDINRMRFYHNEVPKAECMENLTLFWWLSDVYKFVLDVYANARNWNNDDIEKAIETKQRHDRSWVRRKKITGYLKKHILRR